MQPEAGPPAAAALEAAAAAPPAPAGASSRLSGSRRATPRSAPPAARGPRPPRLPAPRPPPRARAGPCGGARGAALLSTLAGAAGLSAAARAAVGRRRRSRRRRRRRVWAQGVEEARGDRGCYRRSTCLAQTPSVSFFRLRGGVVRRQRRGPCHARGGRPAPARGVPPRGPHGPRPGVTARALLPCARSPYRSLAARPWASPLSSPPAAALLACAAAPLARAVQPVCRAT